MPRTVVILSRGGPLLLRLLARLRAGEARPSALLLYREAAGAPGGERGWRGLLAPPARGLLRSLRRARVRLKVPRWLPVVNGGALNGPRLLEALRRLSPDVVVLAGSGLVSPELLAIPREGVVSVHPGVLPWIRGNAGLEHSLLRGVPAGCTAFRVDAGIDTGAMLERRLLQPAGEETLDGLLLGMRTLWAEMSESWLQRALREPLPAGVAQGARFPLCRAPLDAVQRARLAGALAAGTARTQAALWASRCTTGGVLPLDAEPPAGWEPAGPTPAPGSPE